MNNYIKSIEGKYVMEGVDKLTREELVHFLNYNIDKKDAPYREERVKKMKIKLKGLVKAERYLEKQKQGWKEQGEEYKALTEDWMSKGAYWKSVGDKKYVVAVDTVWYYKGIEYFRLISGENVGDLLKRSKVADKKLSNLIKEEK